MRPELVLPRMLDAYRLEREDLSTVYKPQRLRDSAMGMAALA